MCGSSGRFFLYRRESERTLPVAGIGHLLAISGLHISFFGNGLYRGLRKTGFSIYQAGVVGSLLLGSYVVMTGMSVSALGRLPLISDPDGSRADRKGIRWIDDTWDCGNWFASGKSVAAFYGRVPAFFCCGSRYLSDWFGK